MRVLLLVAALWCNATAQILPDPSWCADFIIGSIDTVVNAGNDIAQAATDCTLPWLNELDCSADLTDMFSFWFNLASQLCSAVVFCGNLPDNNCAAAVTQFLGDISDVANELIAAAVDCEVDPFNCAYDVVTVVDSLNLAVLDVLQGLFYCDTPYIPYYPQNGTAPAPEFLPGEPELPLWTDDRRLQEGPDFSATLADPGAAGGAAIWGGRCATRAGLCDEELYRTQVLREEHVKVSSRFKELQARLQRQQLALESEDAQLRQATGGAAHIPRADL